MPVVLFLALVQAAVLAQEPGTANPQALQRFGQGMDKMKLGQWAEAAAEFSAAIDLDPNFAEAHMRLGQARAKMRYFTEARACLEKALEIRPDLTEARISLVDVLLELSGEEDRAESEAKRILLDPVGEGRPEPYFFLGRIAAQRAQREKDPAKRNAGYDEAVGYLRKAVDIAPGVPTLRFALGLVLENSGRPAEAARELSEAVRLDQSNPLYRRHLGEVYFLLRRYAEARIQLIEAGRDEKQRDTDFYMMLSEADLRLGIYPEAAAWVGMAQKAAPSDPNVLLQAGRVHRLLGNADIAEQLIRQAMVLNPTLNDADYQLGMVHFERGQWRQAVEAFRKATQSAPGDYRIWYHLGLALRCLERNEESDRALAKFQELKQAEQARREASGVEMGPPDRIPLTTRPAGGVSAVPTPAAPAAAAPAAAG